MPTRLRHLLVAELKRSPITLSSLWSMHLPPDLQREAARRVGWVALLMLLLDLGFGSVVWLIDLYPDYRMSAAGGAGYIVFALASLGLFLASRSRRVSRTLVIDLGYVYEVIVAFAAGYIVNGLAWPDVVTPSWSPVAVWAFVFAVVIPGPTLKVFLASAMTVAMDPLTLLILVEGGMSMPPRSIVLARFLPSVAAVICALVLSRMMYQLGVQLTEAREMGSYRLIERLGQGGMGEVWRAEHRFLARPAAVKLIRQDRLVGSGMRGADRVVQRFEREAQATASLSSPHTVALYDFGTDETGNFFYVMELLDGLDFETLVERHGPVVPERAAYLLGQVCQSLGEAHDRGLVHRDVKPANIFACRHGGLHDFVKVLDFGLVRPTDTDGTALGDVRLTREGDLAGTPAFLAPELALEPDSVSAAADVYALGCVGFWLLTGRLVFEATTAMGVITRHINEAPPAPSEHSEMDVPPELDALILRCLDKDPCARPSSRDLSTELARLVLHEHWDESRAARWWELHDPSPERQAELPDTLPG